MNTYGPLLATFGFFAILFLVGKHFQNQEKKRRDQEAHASQGREQ
jgi:hypothetical protein